MSQRTSAWATPRLDLAGCVFYAPLWRPNMVARGGSIINGTGTMDVTPQALAVGANTITVTAAGTLIVSMPEGGTVASGTMTVTASPVTISAGIATTITTTGAIGNITCTPSNIIRSKDNNNRALTVTAATWGVQGRVYGGPSNYIDFTGSTGGLTAMPTMSLELWLKHTGGAGAIYVVDGWAGSAATCLLRISSNVFDWRVFSGVSSGVQTGTTALNDSKFHHGVFTYDGANLHTYIDGVEEGNTVAMTGALETIADWTIGADRGHSGAYFTGTIGEIRIYKRALSAGGAMRDTQATKWRYQ